MAMVLTPILKSSTPGKLNNSYSHNVTFTLPDEENVIEYLRNDDVPYSSKLNNVVKKIMAPDTEDSLLFKWIIEFKDNVLFLENNDRIIYALMNLNWPSKDSNFVKNYQELILNLVTAHPIFIKPILGMVLKIFFTVVDDGDEITEQEKVNFENGHNLLKNIIKLVPSSEYMLCALVAEKFPYMKRPTKVWLCCVKNLLDLCSYFTSKRLLVLECIIERLIHIDVHCSRDTIEAYERQKEENESDIMDGDNLDQGSSMAYPLAQTLDVIIDLLFQFIQDTCYSSDKTALNWDATKKLYKELLKVFDKIILPTHGCCHVQYLLFYICSFRQELCDGFLDYLWKKVQNPSIGPVYRQIAAFYIGSFLARAKYISIVTVEVCMDLMCRWIHSYIDNHTSQDLNVHGTFHSVCQTVFYVFAFRSKEFLEKDKGYRFLRSLNLERIVSCRLNPLRYCDRNIVQNFANISRNFQIAYVYPIIEKNNRNLLYLSSQMNLEYCSGAMIQTFFPFDPYLLKRSKHWIESNYRVYNHCHKDDETMDVIDEEDASVNDSIFTYSTSPGFKKHLFPKR